MADRRIDPIELPEGWTIKYKHFRRWPVSPAPEDRNSLIPDRLSFAGAALTTIGKARRDGIRWSPHPKGGETVAVVCNAGGEAVCAEHAFCNAKDNYVKAVGRGIAGGRALQKLAELRYRDELATA